MEPMPGDLWVVNKSMIKTLENRRTELSRLEDEYQPETLNPRKLMEIRQGSSGMKKRAGHIRK
jgi:hypothetical protein